MRRRKLNHIGGFSLVEILIVIILIAVIAGIAIPKFSDSARRSREASLRNQLRLIRSAIDQFFAETGGFPERLSKLDDVITAPSDNRVLLPNGTWTNIPVDRVMGPFLDGRIGWRVVTVHPNPLGGNFTGSWGTPIDPVSNQPYRYRFVNGRVTVHSSATGNDSQGVPYSSY